MGDFLLDLRQPDRRALEGAAQFLRFCPDMQLSRFEFPEFGLVVSSSDIPRIWGPCAAEDGSLLVALNGRIALTQSQWSEAEAVKGSGGLACKFIAHSYQRGGIGSVEALSGNFVVLVADRKSGQLFIVTDRWGLFPGFMFAKGTGEAVFGSHPDALADAVGESRNWDLTSFAEFILTGKLSAPFTYYRAIKALPVGSTTRIALGTGGAVLDEPRCYFRFDYHPQPERNLVALAEEFAAAFRNAVAKRTLPVLGRSAVALSGGLDSRTVLCAAPNRAELVTFSCFDEENPELRIAREIADKAGVEFIPLQRSFDYYGDHAALGVKISAGMGCIASNHFLGFRQKLRELGIDNLLTGCYCDYVFKGLGLNKQVNRWTTRETLGAFDFAYYSAHSSAPTELGRKVRERLEGVFPPALRKANGEATVLALERQRVFPLCYEEDNAERTIPQRTMGWYVPIADNELMDIYLKMSCPLKLNRRLFVQAVPRICGAAISGIDDANTGAPVNAAPWREAVNVHLRRVSGLVRRLRGTKVTTGSWPNWSVYIRQSPVVRSLWESPNRDAQEVFEQVLGKEDFHQDIQAYDGRRVGLFLQLFTLKLWFDQRQ